MPVDIRRFVLDMLILHDFWAFVLYNRSTMVYANAMFLYGIVDFLNFYDKKHRQQSSVIAALLAVFLYSSFV